MNCWKTNMGNESAEIFTWVEHKMKPSTPSKTWVLSFLSSITASISSIKWLSFINLFPFPMYLAKHLFMWYRLCLKASGMFSAIESALFKVGLEAIWTNKSSKQWRWSSDWTLGNGCRLCLSTQMVPNYIWQDFDAHV